MDDSDLPVTWEEMQKEAKAAIAVLENLLKIEVPGSIKDAVDGNYLESASKVTESVLGHTARREIKAWKSRAITLRAANDILANMEDRLVHAYVLSSSSPARVMLDSLIKLPKFLVKHSAEIAFILVPILLAGAKQYGDAVNIERRIILIDREIEEILKQMRVIYGITPGLIEDRDSLRAALVDSEEKIAVLQRERGALVKLSVDAQRFLERSLEAFAVVISYLIVAKLIAVAGSVKDAIVAMTPVIDIRKSAVDKIKVRSLPQFPQRRKTVRKRSRRN